MQLLNVNNCDKSSARDLLKSKRFDSSLLLHFKSHFCHGTPIDLLLCGYFNQLRCKCDQFVTRCFHAKKLWRGKTWIGSLYFSLILNSNKTADEVGRQISKFGHFWSHIWWSLWLSKILWMNLTMIQYKQRHSPQDHRNSFLFFLNLLSNSEGFQNNLSKDWRIFIILFEIKAFGQSWIQKQLLGTNRLGDWSTFSEIPF